MLPLTDLSIVRAESSGTHDMTASKKIIEKNPKVLANYFLKELSERPSEKTKSLKLLYNVYMDAEWKVKTKMSATLEMEKDKDHYISTFSLTEPVGENLWGILT